jgi:hypothetical protein
MHEAVIEGAVVVASVVLKKTGAAGMLVGRA